MKNLIIIPARSGSKGIKNKNLMRINGISLLELSILHAKYISNEDDIICVSSDSKEYLKIASDLNVETRLRPQELVTDEAFTEPVMEDVINQYELDDNDNIILLQPTSPFRSKQLLNELKNVINDGEESVLTVYESYQFEWGKLNEKYYYPKYKRRPRRQDMEPRYIENGSIYLVKLKIFNSLKNRVDNKSKLIISSHLESIDIDSLEDLKIAELLGKEFNEQWKEEIKKL